MKREEPNLISVEHACEIFGSGLIDRLKQHNGELKGGAKASRTGRPWVCACIIQGFKDKSEGTPHTTELNSSLVSISDVSVTACQFESKWKSFSRKLPRKRNDTVRQVDNDSLLLLQHRQAALNRVKGSLVCDHLEINWQLNPS
ncbi:hypothetical protein CK203_114451 [Vitis vinifera]|uniref:Uncharacterized protein n=1 Tax=Vitis vinifera TaxID=29760 RepID=A0A438C904_VITVI|nr:hypothetical protein CK203_114451 [Vitis vinifera]